MKILEELKIVPNNIELFEQAFCHSSYVNEQKLEHNYERLEFLGDAVLDLVITDYLFSNCDEDEGKMTKLRASYVCENALYEYATSLNFSDYIKVGHGEEINGGKYRKAILADTFESFIAALYLDQGYMRVKQFVYKVVVPHIQNNNLEFFNDYKSVLQELVQTSKKSVDYQVIDEVGPAHEKTFMVNVIVDGIVYGKGTAGSKKEAEQEAAKDAMTKLATLE